MHIFLKTIVFGSKKVPDALPGLFLGARSDFKVVFGPGAHQVGANPLKT